MMWSLKSTPPFLILFLIFAFGPFKVRADQIETVIMPDKVIAGHADIEAECEKCHEDFNQAAQDRLCLDCHEKIDRDLMDKKGYHGLDKAVRNVECRSCHTDHIGRDADINLMDEETFNHELSNYSLEGAHVRVVCAGCHEPDKLYREAPSDCYTCHKKDDIHKNELGKECADCHSDKNWTKTEFDHDKTDFALRDAHDEILCSACHPDERYVDLPTRCYSCHKLNDVHAGSYGTTCDDCHNEKKWDRIKFDHNRDTDYPLRGGHRKTTCRACHGDDVDKPLKRECIACHRDDDVHRGRYGDKCDECHTEKIWPEMVFDHDQDTDFKLNGAHAKISCEACHQGAVDDDGGATCRTCHKGDDVHQGEQGKNCETCHGESHWNTEVQFDHQFTELPLIGMHAVTACEECHLTAEYKKSPIECVACHEKDDVHKDKLGGDCELCHNPNHWNLWVFDHDKQSDYPLEGAHKDLDCLTCHTKPVGKNEIVLPIDCYSCHADDDIHLGKFGIQCERCHGFDTFDFEGKVTP